MSHPINTTPLYIHTLETLCDELVSGRPVLVDDRGTEFQLPTAETRAIFDWYRRNRNKWAQRNMKEDVETIADQLEKEPPELPAIDLPSGEQQKRVTHLKSMKVHRFAGIHHYGTPTQAPEDFEVDFNKPLTLIEGANGSGKTSFLSAITWCLTGYVYRSQREPETVDQSVVLKFADETEAVPEDETLYEMAPITPMPAAEALKSLGDNPLPLDTWVELRFVDYDGNDVGQIRRSIKRSPHGKIVVDKPDFSTLGLDPIAREVGTKMPGLIPYIQLGVASDLGKAVAALTGIKPLEDLATHAAKSQAKLKKDLVEDREAEIQKLDEDFLVVSKDLANLIENHPEIKPKQNLPAPGPEKTIEEELTTIRGHFESLQAKTLSEAQSVLGKSFDYDDQDARKDLMDNVGPALGLLDPEEIGKLLSAKRLSDLRRLGDQEFSRTESLLQRLISEANELAKLGEQSDLAARLRLYARVAGWIKEHQQPPHVIEDCPVCQSALEGKIDQITGKEVAEHIRQFLDTESDYLEKTLVAWEKSALETLANELPEVLASEVKRDLPGEPSNLISTALVEERFKSPRFEETLSPLKQAAQLLCEEALGSLPSFTEPFIATLPACFEDKEGGISQAIRRVTRAVAFARWRQDNDVLCKEAFANIIGKTPPGEETAIASETPVEKRPLCQRLAALDRMVKSATPLTEAVSKVETMTKKLAERRKKEARIELYGRTANAIQPLISLSTLVEAQVAFLMSKLSTETVKWKKGFYMPAFKDAPQVVNTDVEGDGSLVLEAEAEGTRALAQHISNASDLRATLLAFLLAFWQYLLDSRGGLSLFLLDEPQELFDKPNRRRVANSIPTIIENGGRVVVATYDHSLARRTMASSIESLGADNVDHRSIHPLNANRPHIELGYFVEEIEKKRRAFEDPQNTNEHQPARDYIKQLRIYIENRLLDFLDVPASDLPNKPTLLDLINAIRRRINAPSEAFASQAFQTLISHSALANGSPFISLMNESHHGNEDEITFNEVWQVKDACVHIRKLVDAAHEEYERWMRRDPREPASVMPDIPEAIAQPSFDVPVIENLAAFTSETAPGEPLQSQEQFSSSLLANHAVYVINTHNFGFSAPIGCRAIVDLGIENVPDKSLVIALHREKIYARRLLCDTTNPEFIALGSEAENPLKRPPSLVLPTEEVRLLMVVGILFDDPPYYARSTKEADLVNDSDLLEKVEIVFKVRGESALPLALPDQVILGGSCLDPRQLREMEGSLVAIATSEGSALKRIGKAVPGAPHIRQFESIGGLGESMLVRTEDIDEDAFGNLPLLHSARRVLGVLYNVS